ncbi:MAG: hypothetical protein QOE24_648, partial [Frankiales bacterium]|nr:hypothetical protein [Frankiales bacterium]
MAKSLGSRATVRDVAAETGVSIATVSRVLNDHASVSPETRELVRQAVERLGEHAPGPRATRARTTLGSVYVRCPYLLSDYFGLIVSSIAETLELYGKQLVLNAGEASQHASVLPGLHAKAGISG